MYVQDEVVEYIDPRISKDDAMLLVDDRRQMPRNETEKAHLKCSTREKVRVPKTPGR